MPPKAEFNEFELGRWTWTSYMRGLKYLSVYFVPCILSFICMLDTFPEDFSQVSTSQLGIFLQVATFQMCNFPSGNFPSLS